MREWISVLLGCVLTVQSGKLPDSIPRCHRSDPFLDQCLVGAIQAALPQLAKAASIPRCHRYDPFLDQCLVGAVQVALHQLAKGVPELNFPSMDPWSIGDLELPLGEDGSASVKMTNVVHRGISSCHVLGVRAELDNSRLDLHVLCPLVSVRGDYTADVEFKGRPLKSNGKVTVSLSNLRALVSPTGNRLTRGGRSFFNFEYVSTVVKSLGSLKFKLEGQDSDPKENAALNSYLDNNVAELWEYARPKWEPQFSYLLTNFTRPIFNNVPISDIFLEDLLLYYF